MTSTNGSTLHSGMFAKAHGLPPPPPHSGGASLTVCLSDTLPNPNLSSPRPERPKSLVLIGVSRLGKTQWARSLGDHAYVSGMWDLSAFDGLPSHFWDFGYVVFDDLDWDTFKLSRKSWLGGQRDFSVTDKYRRKRRIPGGIPAIVCLNQEDFTEEFRSFCFSNWGLQNIEVVTLTNKLY